MADTGWEDVLKMFQSPPPTPPYQGEQGARMNWTQQSPAARAAFAPTWKGVQPPPSLPALPGSPGINQSRPTPPMTAAPDLTRAITPNMTPVTGGARIQTPAEIKRAQMLHDMVNRNLHPGYANPFQPTPGPSSVAPGRLNPYMPQGAQDLANMAPGSMD